MKERKIPVFEISTGSQNLDDINGKIDLEIKKYFIGQQVCIRALGSEVHKGKSVDELIDIIRNTGTDRYDPLIRSDRYDNAEGKRVDFFALDFFIDHETKILDEFTWRKKLRPPLKIDIVIVYDISRVERVAYTPIGRTKSKSDGFAFKDASRKREAVKAIFKIHPA